MNAELQLRRATLAPITFDEASSTVRVTFTTGAPVPRIDMDGPFLERLLVDRNAIDLSSFVGAHALDAHQARGVRDILGVVVAAGVENGAGWADIKFSSRPEVQPIVRDIRDGIIRQVSVGYRVLEWRDSVDPSTKQRVRTAVRWTPYEVSFVPIGADPGASIRKGEFAMEVTTQTNNQSDPPASPATIPAAFPATRADVNRQIRVIAQVAGLNREFADEMIDRGLTADQARAAAFQEMERRSSTQPIHSFRVEVGASNDDPQTRVTRMSEALACRALGNAPSDAARPYMSRSLLDMAAELLQLRGERISTFSREELLRRSLHTTSDFPQLLTSTGNRVLLSAFEAAPNPLKLLARQTTIDDFRPKTALKLGDLPPLKRVNQGGEVGSTTRSEAKESYSLGTFAQLFSLSRNALINDDLGAFNDWSLAMGRAAAETEARELLALLTANSGTGVTMDDGQPLFHTTHQNVAASGGAISVTTLSAGRQAMRVQTGVGGQPINATARYLLVPPGAETVAEQTVAQLYPSIPAEVNPFSTKLEVLVEPRLTGNRWYLFADPKTTRVLEYAYLSSAQGPQLASREGWEVLGMEFRVVLDFGCGAIDHRGAYANAGA